MSVNSVTLTYMHKVDLTKATLINMFIIISLEFHLAPQDSKILLFASSFSVISSILKRFFTVYMKVARVIEAQTYAHTHTRVCTCCNTHFKNTLSSEQCDPLLLYTL